LTFLRIYLKVDDTIGVLDDGARVAGEKEFDANPLWKIKYQNKIYFKLPVRLEIKKYVI
jgi:hypothetical protein